MYANKNPFHLVTQAPLGNEDSSLLYLGAILALFSIYFNYVGSRSIYLTPLTWFS